jgi:hypothetical protein
MKRQALAVLGLTAITLIGTGTMARAADPVAVPPAAPAPGTMADDIAAITQAKTVPDAVSAFSRGLAVDRGNAKLYQAYVQRLVELDMPDLAVTPAQALVSLQPDNAMALAVLGLDAAQKGDMRVAMTDVVIAGTRDAEEPFVQHAAGQIVAWYDTAPDHAAVPASIVTSLETLRPQIQNKTYFADAYKQAVQAYKERAAAAAKLAQTSSAKPDVPDMHTPTAAAPPPAAAPAPPVTNNYYPAQPAPAAQAPAVVYTSPTYVYTPAYYPPAYYAPAYPYYAPYPFVGLSFGFRFGGGGHFHR